MGEGDFFRRLDAMIYARCLREWQGIYPWAVWTAPTTVWSSSSPGRWAWPAPGPSGFPQAEEELARLADRLISSGLAGTLQHFD